MKKEEIIARDPDVMNGMLVFAGTRVPVEILIQHLTAGDTIDVFLDDFPTVTRAQAVAYLEMTLEAAEKMSLAYLEERAGRGIREKYDAVLARVPDVEPEEHDRL